MSDHNGLNFGDPGYDGIGEDDPAILMITGGATFPTAPPAGGGGTGGGGLTPAQIQAIYDKLGQGTNVHISVPSANDNLRYSGNRAAWYDSTGNFLRWDPTLDKVPSAGSLTPGQAAQGQFNNSAALYQGSLPNGDSIYFDPATQTYSYGSDTKGWQYSYTDPVPANQKGPTTPQGSWELRFGPDGVPYEYNPQTNQRRDANGVPNNKVSASGGGSGSAPIGYPGGGSSGGGGGGGSNAATQYALQAAQAATAAQAQAQQQQDAIALEQLRQAGQQAIAAGNLQLGYAQLAQADRIAQQNAQHQNLTDRLAAASQYSKDISGFDTNALPAFLQAGGGNIMNALSSGASALTPAANAAAALDLQTARDAGFSGDLSNPYGALASGASGGSVGGGITPATGSGGPQAPGATPSTLPGTLGGPKDWELYGAAFGMRPGYTFDAASGTFVPGPTTGEGAGPAGPGSSGWASSKLNPANNTVQNGIGWDTRNSGIDAGGVLPTVGVAGTAGVTGYAPNGVYAGISGSGYAPQPSQGTYDPYTSHVGSYNPYANSGSLGGVLTPSNSGKATGYQPTFTQNVIPGTPGPWGTGNAGSGPPTGAPAPAPNATAATAGHAIQYARGGPIPAAGWGMVGDRTGNPRDEELVYAPQGAQVFNQQQISQNPYLAMIMRNAQQNAGGGMIRRPMPMRRSMPMPMPMPMPQPGMGDSPMAQMVPHFAEGGDINPYGSMPTADSGGSMTTQPVAAQPMPQGDGPQAGGTSGWGAPPPTYATAPSTGGPGTTQPGTGGGIGTYTPGPGGMTSHAPGTIVDPSAGGPTARGGAYDPASPYPVGNITAQPIAGGPGAPAVGGGGLSHAPGTIPDPSAGSPGAQGGWRDASPSPPPPTTPWGNTTPNQNTNPGGTYTNYTGPINYGTPAASPEPSAPPYPVGNIAAQPAPQQPATGGSTAPDGTPMPAGLSPADQVMWFRQHSTTPGYNPYDISYWGLTDFERQLQGQSAQTQFGIPAELYNQQAAKYQLQGPKRNPTYGTFLDQGF